MCDVVRNRDALRLERAQDGGVVDEVAENREGTGIRLLEREPDGIANAEAHTEVSGSDDAHTLQHKVYCLAHFVKSVRPGQPVRTTIAQMDGRRRR